MRGVCKTVPRVQCYFSPRAAAESLHVILCELSLPAATSHRPAGTEGRAASSRRSRGSSEGGELVGVTPGVPLGAITRVPVRPFLWMADGTRGCGAPSPPTHGDAGAFRRGQPSPRGRRARPEACAAVGVALRKARRIPDARSNRPDTGVRLENVGSPGPCPEAGGPAPSVVLGSGWPP